MHCPWTKDIIVHILEIDLGRSLHAVILCNHLLYFQRAVLVPTWVFTKLCELLAPIEGNKHHDHLDSRLL